MFLSFVISISITLIATAVLVRLRLVTLPCKGSQPKNDKKASGGGIAFIIAFYILFIVSYLTSKLDENLFIAILGSGCLVAITGFYSDKLKINNFLKITLQTLALIWGIFWLSHPFGSLLIVVLPLPEFNLDWGYFGLLVIFVSSFWIVSKHKILDQIESLCASNSIFILMSAAFLSFLIGQNDDSLIYLALGLPLLTFLLFNFPPARIIMGEVGSSFIGVFLALMAIYSANKLGYWSFGILLGLFIAHSFVNILRGLLAKDELFDKPTNSKIADDLTFQVLYHKHIVFYYLKINLFLNFPLALLALYYPDKGVYFCSFSWVMCFLFLQFYKAPKKHKLVNSKIEGGKNRKFKKNDNVKKPSIKDTFINNEANVEEKNETKNETKNKNKIETQKTLNKKSKNKVVKAKRKSIKTKRAEIKTKKKILDN